MNLSKIQLAIIGVFIAIIIAVFVGASFSSQDADLMEQVGDRAIEECQKRNIDLSIGRKHTQGFIIKTYIFDDVVADFAPFRLTFSSISATPSLTAITDNVVDGKLSAHNVTLVLPFLGAINFGDGSAHVHIDKENNAFVRDFEFKGLCKVKGHFTITKDSDFTDYRFVFMPSPEQQSLFATLKTFGTPFKKTDNDHWILESETK